MRISAKIDYAVRACVQLASLPDDEWANAEAIGTAQGIPTAYLLSLLAKLRAQGIVESRRGVDGGYRLGKPAYAITVADIIRVIDGPLATVAGSKVEDVEYPGAASSLRDTWVALRAAMRDVLEKVTIEAIAAGKLPLHVRQLIEPSESWVTRPNVTE